MVNKMKPPTGARIATTILTEADFSFMLAGPIAAGRVPGVGGVTLAGGAGRGLSAVGDIA